MERVLVSEHESLLKYRDTMVRIIGSMYPEMDRRDLESAVDYSVSKRFKNFNLTIQNNYTNKTINMTVLEMIDYIARRQPIITSYGTMFKRHEAVPKLYKAS